MEFASFVLVAVTTDLGNEPLARDHADAVEFRMDLADGEPLAALREYDGELPILATNRVEREGGEAPDDDERLDVLAEAAELPTVDAVDVELATLGDGDGERVASHARRHGAAVVASVHDFERTPPVETLRELLDSATDRGDVGKLAVTAERRGDVLDLLTVTSEFSEAGSAVATMAMDEPGRHSRAVAPLYGSKIGYAPVDPANATAPGQYDLATLSELVETLQ